MRPTQHVPVWALQVQDMLWQGYQSKGAQRRTGHLRHAQHACGHGRADGHHGLETSTAPPGIALSAFAVLILLGSIHLGWHYALDGYVGAAGAALVWHLVGRLLGSHAAAPAMHMATVPCMSKEGLTS